MPQSHGLLSHNSWPVPASRCLRVHTLSWTTKRELKKLCSLREAYVDLGCLWDIAPVLMADSYNHSTWTLGILQVPNGWLLSHKVGQKSTTQSEGKRELISRTELASSPAASALLREIETTEENPGLRHRRAGASSSNGPASNRPAASSSSAKPRPEPSSSSRSYTPQQSAVVKRIIACSKTVPLSYLLLTIARS